MGIRTEIFPSASSSVYSTRSSAHDQTSWPIPPKNWREEHSENRLLKNPDLRLVSAEAYIMFANALLEDAIWRLESRLIYDRFNRIPKDHFNTLLDDPHEGLPGYGFLSEYQNQKFLYDGFFDILKNYGKILTAKPNPSYHVYTNKNMNAVRFVSATVGNEAVEYNRRKQFGAPWRSSQQRNTDRVGQLLMDAGYRPNPGDVEKKELEEGQYPVPTQYYTDMQAFLESILCLILTTCPQIMDNDDIVGLSLINNSSNPVFDQPQWRQEWLFPSPNGGYWSLQRFDTILRRETKSKLRVSIGVDDFRAIYHNLREQVGEGWLREVEYSVHGDKSKRCEIQWAKENPDAEDHPGGQRYLIKHFESVKISPVA
ncbi:hypothetical protein ABW20_dc0104556 [Dactylellina cionopaga]|nr:hypothetical protein ABW20_dc0104556 [Dactylellina cionopaga]